MNDDELNKLAQLLAKNVIRMMYEEIGKSVFKKMFWIMVVLGAAVVTVVNGWLPPFMK